MGREEKRASSKQVSQTRFTTAKERSTERKKRVSNENNNTSPNGVETRGNGSKESERNTEIVEIPQIEVN